MTPKPLPWYAYRPRTPEEEAKIAVTEAIRVLGSRLEGEDYSNLAHAIYQSRCGPGFPKRRACKGCGMMSIRAACDSTYGLCILCGEVRKDGGR